MTDLSTTRLHRHLKQRQVAFCATGATAGDTLAALPAGTQTAYLIGPAPASGWLPWALSGLDDGSWEPSDHYLDATAPVLRYVSQGGRRVELHRATQWFGHGRYSAAQAAEGWEMLGRVIGQTFPDATLLATPATTARELFLRTIPRGRAYPVLDLDTQRLIRSTDGQGRIEVLPPGGHKSDWDCDNMPALFEYDGRLMYAALCRELPAGVPIHDAGDTYLGQTRARYLVRVTVPRDWDEPFGLLGHKRDDGSRLWEYPNERGRTFTTWADGAELWILAKHAPEWWRDLRILERLHWPNVDGGRPLDNWAAKLIDARALCERIAQQSHDLEHAAGLAALAVRSLILHGIGAFHGRAQPRTGYARAGEPLDLPAAATNVRLEGDWIVYTIPGREPSGDSWRARLSHPEWSAAVWARARARLLAAPGSTGALYRTDGEVVAFRTDAVYLTARQRWNDDGRIGRFRCKSWRAGPMPWPANGTELLELRDGAQ